MAQEPEYNSRSLSKSMKNYSGKQSTYLREKKDTGRLHAPLKSDNAQPEKSKLNAKTSDLANAADRGRAATDLDSVLDFKQHRALTTTGTQTGLNPELPPNNPNSAKHLSTHGVNDYANSKVSKEAEGHRALTTVGRHSSFGAANDANEDDEPSHRALTTKLKQSASFVEDAVQSSKEARLLSTKDHKLPQAKEEDSGDDGHHRALTTKDKKSQSKVEAENSDDEKSHRALTTKERISKKPEEAEDKRDEKSHRALTTKER